MPTEVALRVTVDTEVGELSVGELKQGVKDLTLELNKAQVGTEKYKQTLSKLGEVRGQLKDLKDDIKALDPDAKFRSLTQISAGVASGFQAAQGAVALFGSESEDLARVLVRVQAASALAQGLQGIKGLGDAFRQFGLVLKANPIMLIASVIIGIGTALFALKDKIPLVGKAFELLGNFIHDITEIGKDFTDWIGLTSFAMDEMHQKVIDNATKAATALGQRYDREIKYAKAAGKETIEIEKLKQKAILETLKIQASEIYFTAMREKRKLNEGEIAQLEEIKNKMIEAYVDTNVAAIEANTKRHDDAERKRKKELDDIQSFRDEVETVNKEAHTKRLEAEKIEDDDFFQRYILDVQEGNDQVNADYTESYNERMAQLEEERRLNEAVQAARYQVASDTTAAIKSLGDLLFDHQLQRAQGNIAKQREIQKRAFNFNKAIAVTETVINTVKGISNALATYPYPYNLVIAALAGVLGTAQTAAIASKKFPEGGAADTSVNTPSSGGGGSAPNIQSPQAQQLSTSSATINQNQQGQFTGFGSGGRQQEPIKAYVVETELTSTQKTIRSIQERTTY